MKILWSALLHRATIIIVVSGLVLEIFVTSVFGSADHCSTSSMGFLLVLSNNRSSTKNRFELWHVTSRQMERQQLRLMPYTSVAGA